MVVLRIVLAVFAVLGMVVLEQPTNASAQCGPATQQTRVLDAPAHELGIWVLDSGTWRVVNVWSNMPDITTQGERKLILSPDQYVELLGGGSAWYWPEGCERQARDGYRQNPLPEVTPSELAADWLCCGREVLELWAGYLAQKAVAQAPPVQVSPPVPVVVPVVQPPVVIPPTPVPSCPAPQINTFPFPRDVFVSGPAIVSPWWSTRTTPFGQAQVRVLVPQGQAEWFFAMQGEVKFYQPTTVCIEAMNRDWNNSSLWSWTPDQLRPYGLVGQVSPPVVVIQPPVVFVPSPTVCKPQLSTFVIPTNVPVTGPAIVYPRWDLLGRTLPFGNAEIRVLVPQGVSVWFFAMKGLVWSFDSTFSCLAMLNDAWGNSTTWAWTIEQLRPYGLVS